MYHISKIWSRMLGCIKYVISRIDILMAKILLQAYSFKHKNFDKFYFKQLPSKELHSINHCILYCIIKYRHDRKEILWSDIDENQIPTYKTIWFCLVIRRLFHRLTSNSDNSIFISFSLTFWCILYNTFMFSLSLPPFFSSLPFSLLFLSFSGTLSFPILNHCHILLHTTDNLIHLHDCNYHVETYHVETCRWHTNELHRGNANIASAT